MNYKTLHHKASSSSSPKGVFDEASKKKVRMETQTDQKRELTEK